MRKLMPVSAIALAALLAAPGQAVAQAVAQAGAAVGGVVGWPWPVYGPYGPYPYPYDAYAPWGPCAPGICVDGMDVRRAVRREMQLQELRRELELRAAGGFPGGGASPYGVPRDPPPPTPESHLQPQYRGSGDVRPEFRGAGQPR